MGTVNVGRVKCMFLGMQLIKSNKRLKPVLKSYSSFLLDSYAGKNRFGSIRFGSGLFEDSSVENHVSRFDANRPAFSGRALALSGKRGPREATPKPPPLTQISVYCRSTTCRVQNPDIPQAGRAGQGAAGRGRAGRGKAAYLPPSDMY